MQSYLEEKLTPQSAERQYVPQDWLSQGWLALSAWRVLVHLNKAELKSYTKEKEIVLIVSLV